MGRHKTPAALENVKDALRKSMSRYDKANTKLTFRRRMSRHKGLFDIAWSELVKEGFIQEVTHHGVLYGVLKGQTHFIDGMPIPVPTDTQLTLPDYVLRRIDTDVLVRFFVNINLFEGIDPDVPDSPEAQKSDRNHFIAALQQYLKDSGIEQSI